MAFLLCVEFSDYGVVREVGSCVSGYLIGRYIFLSSAIKGFMMNVDKAKKRILKRVQRGFKGYPQISLEYFGKTTDFATEVVITFVPEENAEAQIQRFTSDKDVREDEAIQSVLLKIIERADAATVLESREVSAC